MEGDSIECCMELTDSLHIINNGFENWTDSSLHDLSIQAQEVVNNDVNINFQEFLETSNPSDEIHELQNANYWIVTSDEPEDKCSEPYNHENLSSEIELNYMRVTVNDKENLVNKWIDEIDAEIIGSLNNQEKEETCLPLNKTKNIEEIDNKINEKKKTKNKRSKKSENSNTKKQRNPEAWKVNVVKHARLRGLEYMGVGGKIVPARVMGPPCNCRWQCQEKIRDELRKNIYDKFWQQCSWEERKQYIAASVKESSRQYSNRNGKKSCNRRPTAFTYILKALNMDIRVCKSMFLNTFAVSEKFVRHAIEKKRLSPAGIIGPDLRGKHSPITKKSEAVKEEVRAHIESFPTSLSKGPNEPDGKRYLSSTFSVVAMHKMYVSQCKEKGIPKKDIVKESYYREIFKKEYNYGFKNFQETEE